MQFQSFFIQKIRNFQKNSTIKSQVDNLKMNKKNVRPTITAITNEPKSSIETQVHFLKFLSAIKGNL